ncbi:hypothetical protein YYE_04403 [Plasmodium vinckei vinckei]|uniref:PIR protein CIR protein n=1 Tax=Plasmodium vinckei vinckei TaxID=54757 RepID=A0A081IA66_PLAVN|nr:hypothetical protein YYE_04403 [Plasmodium vinckei vinckei]
MNKYKQMCKLLLEGDNYFKDENVDTEEIKKNEKIKGYCSSNGCKTNEAHINALIAYIIMTFKESIKRAQKYNDYDEYLLMWVSDKLLKIHKKGKGKKIEKGYMDAFTLKQAYEDYLVNHKQKLDYWDILNMQPGLKEANLWYMSGFYKLLNIICKMITDYNNGAKSNKVLKYSADCSFQYKTLYKNISECKSYLDLLNKLKGIYDDFSSAIKKNSSNINLATKLKKLTPEDGEEMEAVRRFISYDFSNSKCKLTKKKKKKASPAADSPPPQSAQDYGSSKTPQTGGSSSGNGNPGDGSSDPASSTPGGSFDLGSSILKFLLNGMEKLNKASQFIQTNQQKVKEVADKIGGAYNNTVDNLKSAYDKSSSYLSEFINNLTNQLNQDDPPKSGSNQPGSGSPSAGGNSNNQLQSPSAINPTDPPTSTKDPISTTPTTTSIDPASQKQSSLQTQSTTPQNPQVKQTNHQKIGQFVKSLSSDLILKKPWNIFPTTLNGSGDCKPEIKFMNVTLVCCTSEQCSLTGISVTIVLIPIILLIAYKYLSFGSSKKSEKKNMKRVINFHDGNRKTKLIISSNDRRKHLKSVINSVDAYGSTFKSTYNE